MFQDLKIPADLVNFLLVAVFALLIGLEQRKHHEQQSNLLFGSDRTFALIGILGFILYVSDKSHKLFVVGFVALTVFLAIYYFFKLKEQNSFGLTSVVVALITYSLTPLVYLEEPWLLMAVVVGVLVLVEIKDNLNRFSRKFGQEEFTTLAKFIVISGVILPILPDKPISDLINISPYHFWLAIVVVSGISYFSYLLKKFVFPESGLLLTAFLGGLYSSTATTVILAKKSAAEDPKQTSAGIILATGVMYFRILILAWIFNPAVARGLLPYFTILMLASFALAYVFYSASDKQNKNFHLEADRNPLEFKTALIFGALFAFFAVVSHLVITKFGNSGIGVLSLIVGVTDIDPYLLSLFQGGDIATKIIVMSTLVATSSNNLAKMIYALSLGSKAIKRKVIIGFSTLIALGLILAFISLKLA